MSDDISFYLLVAGQDDSKKVPVSFPSTATLANLMDRSVDTLSLSPLDIKFVHQHNLLTHSPNTLLKDLKIAPNDIVRVIGEVIARSQPVAPTQPAPVKSVSPPPEKVKPQLTPQELRRILSNSIKGFESILALMQQEPTYCGAFLNSLRAHDPKMFELCVANIRVFVQLITTDPFLSMLEKGGASGRNNTLGNIPRNLPPTNTNVNFTFPTTTAPTQPQAVPPQSTTRLATTPAPAQPPTPGIVEGDVQQLMDILRISRDRATQLLQQSNGDVGMATNLHFASFD
eukprot:PhF_6_TR3350/c0_g1_i2/m.4747